MIRRAFFFLFILLVCLIQSTITTIPFLIGILLLGYIFFQDSFVFFTAFIIGLLFDILSFHTVGTTSLYLLLFLFLVHLYERKFEIQTFVFVIFAGFLGSFGFLLVFSYHYVFIQTGIVLIIISFIFLTLSKLIKKEKRYEETFQKTWDCF